MKNGVWTLETLQAHLQDAIALELWTIPFYFTAMYSIRDPASDAYQLTQSVVYEEMLHLQIACNLCNAFGGTPALQVPKYGGPKVPHLDFRLDAPDPTALFSPHTTALGAMDLERINSMCLIEYPEWNSHTSPNVQPDRTQYGSIGEFYTAIRVGVTELRDAIQGGRRQVDFFSAYYNNMPVMTISKSGHAGYEQAMGLIEAIVEQGEGQTQGDADIPREYQNTADGLEESWPHFRKFISIRDSGVFPETYPLDPDPGPAGERAQRILIENFAAFIALLNRMFSGEPVEDFGAQMATLGGNILTCWQHGVVPRYS